MTHWCQFLLRVRGLSAWGRHVAVKHPRIGLRTRTIVQTTSRCVHVAENFGRKCIHLSVPSVTAHGPQLSYRRGVAASPLPRVARSRKLFRPSLPPYSISLLAV